MCLLLCTAATERDETVRWRLNDELVCGPLPLGGIESSVEEGAAVEEVAIVDEEAVVRSDMSSLLLLSRDV